MSAPELQRRTWRGVGHALVGDPESVARWVTLALFVVALVGTSRTVGLEVSPVLGWAVLLVVSGASAAMLLRRWFDDVAHRRDVAAYREANAPEELTLPDGFDDLDGRG